MVQSGHSPGKQTSEHPQGLMGGSCAVLTTSRLPAESFPQPKASRGLLLDRFRPYGTYKLLTCFQRLVVKGGTERQRAQGRR